MKGRLLMGWEAADLVERGSQRLDSNEVLSLGNRAIVCCCIYIIGLYTRWTC